MNMPRLLALAHGLACLRCSLQGPGQPYRGGFDLLHSLHEPAKILDCLPPVELLRLTFGRCPICHAGALLGSVIHGIIPRCWFEPRAPLPRLDDTARG